MEGFVCDSNETRKCIPSRYWPPVATGGVCTSPVSCVDESYCHSDDPEGPSEELPGICMIRQKRAGTRARRLRDALAACSAAFNTIHDELEWAIEHSKPGEHRDQLAALHAPLLALLDRYPPRARTTTEEVEDAEGEVEPSAAAE